MIGIFFFKTVSLLNMKVLFKVYYQEIFSNVSDFSYVDSRKNTK